MASTDGAPVPREGEQKPEDTDDEKEPGQSEEPVSVAPQVPGTDQKKRLYFTIGTENAFEEGIKRVQHENALAECITIMHYKNASE